MDKWLPCIPILPKTLIDGERTKFWASPLLMRQKQGGHWVYRRPTEQEEQDFVSRESW